MKIFLLCIMSIYPSMPFQTAGKTDLICQKWLEVGLKVFGNEYKRVDKQSAETFSFSKNGTLTKVIYGNLKYKGQWRFSADSTKVAMELTELNGIAIKNVPLEKIKPTDSIIKLTRDTLILGSLGYYGDMRVYGHDDRY